MAGLREIRKRIKSVKNTQKITRAMKLVAASKLRRAQEAIVSQRPYALELGALLHRVATRTESGEQLPHPLLELREPKRVLLVVLTSDRGLCGAFNSNILKRAERFLRENDGKFEKLEVATIGRKGRDYFKKRKQTTVRDYPGVFEKLAYRRATEIAEGIAEEFVKSDLDAVYLVYNEFKSAISQKVVVEQLLPIVHEELPVGENIDYLYEPSQTGVLDKLVPRYISVLVWRAMLESTASEHGARMSSMDSATRNAKELVDKLTLFYNRARQSAITKELLDIVGGAEALKG